MSDVAEIARALTPEQQRAVMSSSDQWKRLWGAGTGAFKGAKVRTLFDYEGWQGSQGWQHSARLTPLGLAVRAHLQQQEDSK